MGLALKSVGTGCGAILARRQPCEFFECSRKVALVEKSCGKRDVSKWSVGSGNLSAGDFDAPLANIFADGAAVESAKFAGEMNRMYADDFRQCGKS